MGIHGGSARHKTPEQSLWRIPLYFEVSPIYLNKRIHYAAFRALQI